MDSFESLGLSERALEAVRLLGYDQPTAVQQRAIPAVLEGRDVIAAAKTGTGKTAAFSLPLLDRIGHAKGGQGPLLLVITPTRELAMQIGEVCATIAQATHHRILTVVGGLAYGPQIQSLKRGADVLIATPGRLEDLIKQDAVRLKDVEALVLDEADRMLDMGFWPAVKRIVAATPRTRQTLLFSATIDEAVDKHASELVRDPVYAEVAHRGEVADTIEQYIIRTPKTARPEYLAALLKEKGWQRVIVFARTRRGADGICRRLRKAGYSADAIHADRSQNARKRSLDRFAAGEVDIVVATDVLARGIDVDQVSYVVNYDLPATPESYVHRIGRTGRAGEAGFAVSFVTPDTESELAAIEKLTKHPIATLELRGFSSEDAQRTAAQKQAKRAAREDPDIAQAKREMAKERARKRRKAAKAKGSEEGSEQAPGKRSDGAKGTQKAPSADDGKGGADGNRTSRGKKNPGRSRKGGAPRTGQSRRKGDAPRSGQNPRKAAAKPAARKADMRPGRAHRADVARRRSSRH